MTVEVDRWPHRTLLAALEHCAARKPRFVSILICSMPYKRSRLQHFKSFSRAHCFPVELSWMMVLFWNQR